MAPQRGGTSGLVMWGKAVCRAAEATVQGCLPTDSASPFSQEYGIPKHFGLFYAMGIALMMEGVLSACYHVCPNYSNFQFGN